MIDREQIIEEIKRTAKANGGTALGVRRFETETGIGPYVWSRFWARFAEAQNEAGFASNAFVTAISDDVLLEHLIALIRDLKRYPTVAELSMRGRNDDQFPTEKVFRRFGDKQQKLAKLMTYCRERPGYEDIIAICEPHVVSVVIQQEVDAPRGDVRAGYVYMLKFRHKDYKIGASTDPERRYGEIATKMPEAPQQIHTIKTDDPFGVEAYWHRRFAAKQLDKRSEWFQLTSADVSAFRRWKHIF